VTSNINFAYDNVGRRSLLSFPNGITVQYGYDADSHLTGIMYQEGSTTLGNLAYASYDSLGRRFQVGGSYAQTNIPAVVSSTLYNANNQLKTWGSATYGYDLNGNVQSDGTNTYVWDLRNRLSTISGGSTASFQYDGLGRRINKTINGTSTSFLYDGLNAGQELSGSSVIANIISGLGLDGILVRTDSTGSKFPLADVLGSALVLSNTSGLVQTQYTYEPFGNTTATGSSSTNSFQYTGRENDGTGLYFYRARYYEPTTDRFISEDPLRSSDRPNWYRYVSNNPLLFNDPLGLTETCTFSGEHQLTPWIPYKTETTPLTGWSLTWSGETGGPDTEARIPFAILNCKWQRIISRTTWSGALFELTWNCTDTSPCGVTRRRIRYDFDWRHQISVTTQIDTDVQSFPIMATDSDTLDEYYCLQDSP
jgi:RHS repeat-associated protein